MNSSYSLVTKLFSKSSSNIPRLLVKNALPSRSFNNSSLRLASSQLPIDQAQLTHDFQGLSLKDLKKQCALRGLKVSGKKSILLGRLIEFDTTSPLNIPKASIDSLKNTPIQNAKVPAALKKLQNLKNKNNIKHSKEEILGDSNTSPIVKSTPVSADPSPCEAKSTETIEQVQKPTNKIHQAIDQTTNSETKKYELEQQSKSINDACIAPEKDVVESNNLNIELSAQDNLKAHTNKTNQEEITRQIKEEELAKKSEHEELAKKAERDELTSEPNESNMLKQSTLNKKPKSNENSKPESVIIEQPRTPVTNFSKQNYKNSKPNATTVITLGALAALWWGLHDARVKKNDEEGK
ncbi:hypothetical protein TBLA_0B00500 [Henningerozyma blattae CBS 6284]|uniref:SAP domain-containing protein n=1 Tax=Henningerozyma blattae (strain ATCC 34711 / CBS 6284 / DSM 70876 / NBRC 10599 / NRRL Y-10934 / UCD 77-7) TaxID=1071380 RepID=I2GXP2_HENB6|nr:hypothetical protein TBLA_0B00500 [Tetrapisispora blattae CBS 6284]CCH58894.1 hypothetical protein TBLA_0B00500 [Tetrapisispora blattae CBS 6284]